MLDNENSGLLIMETIVVIRMFLCLFFILAEIVCSILKLQDAQLITVA